MEVVVKKYGNTHALWFSRSKSFLLFEKPAFDIYMMLQEKMDRQEIVDYCQAKYGHIEHRVEQFVDEITELLLHYNSPKAVQKLSQKERFDDSIQAAESVQPVTYKIGGKKIRINYGHPNLVHAIHPLQAHLAIPGSEETEHVIDCFVEKNTLVCKYKGKLVEAFSTDDVEYFTGNVRQLQYSIVFEKGFYDWMSMLHASGIEKDGRSVLFSAAAGSGKTTISALLKAHGYGFLSDDFIAVDEHGSAYPFPAAISVKKGSVEVLSSYYPELKSTNPEKTFVGKTVQYLPVANINKNAETQFPVGAFVFVQYSAKAKLTLKSVDKPEALKHLLAETWINPSEKYVRRFFDWVEKTPFYSLKYSSTSDALKAVEQIYSEMGRLKK